MLSAPEYSGAGAIIVTTTGLYYISLNADGEETQTGANPGNIYLQVNGSTVATAQTPDSIDLNYSTSVLVEITAGSTITAYWPSDTEPLYIFGGGISVFRLQ